MKKIVFLSCQSLAGFITDETFAVEELKARGFEVSLIPWDADVDWGQFDLALIRTTWDYTTRVSEFLEKLEKISLKTTLLNSLEVVRWNYHKRYLGELEKKGVRIVPTHFFSYPGKVELPSDWKYKRYIIKPCVSASAYKTMIVNAEDLAQKKFEKDLFAGDWMLQPFLEEITQGEISLHYFAGKFSHGILKIPKQGDFRVQEEHGGDIQSFTPEAKLLTLANYVIEQAPYPLLYARVDLVPVRGEYLLMELECIEPALYFRTHPKAASNFADALMEWISQSGKIL